MFEVIDLLLTASPSPVPSGPIVGTIPTPGPAAPDQLYWGMPLPALLAVIALISAVATAVVTGLVKKFRSPQDDREDKVVVLDASDRLIQRFEKALADSDEKHGKEIAALATEVDKLKKEVETMRRERFGLIAALMKAVEIAKKYGGSAAELELENLELPDGIVI